MQYKTKCERCGIDRIARAERADQGLCRDCRSTLSRPELLLWVAS